MPSIYLSTSPPSQTVRGPPPSPRPSTPTQKRTESLWHYAFKQTLFASVSVGTSSLFVTTLSGILLYVAASTICVAGQVFFHAMQLEMETFSQKVEKLESKDETPQSRLLKWVEGYFPQMGKGLCFGLLDLTTRQVLVHEGGHYLAAILLLKNSTPSITIEPWKLGGFTRFYATGKATVLGEKLSAPTIKAIISGAGAGFGTLLSCGDLFMAFLLRKSHPEISHQLTACAVMGIAQNCLYAISAFWENSPGHDFVHLMSLGIHPLVCVTAFVALPAAFKLSLIAYDHLISHVQTPGL